MANNFNIPKIEQEIIKPAKIIINPPAITDVTTKQAAKIIGYFGLATLRTQIYKPGIGQVVSRAGIIPDIGMTPSRSNYKSRFGTAIFSNLQIQDVTYNGNTYHMDSIDTVLYDINQTKEIIKTKIQGRSGTVKEYIADGDFVINIKGVITGDNGVYPMDDVNYLADMLSLPIALKINSDLLATFGIFQVVVESYHIPQVEGGQSQQSFEINCISDQPVELQIQQANS